MFDRQDGLFTNVQGFEQCFKHCEGHDITLIMNTGEVNFLYWEVNDILATIAACRLGRHRNGHEYLLLRDWILLSVDSEIETNFQLRLARVEGRHPYCVQGIHRHGMWKCCYEGWRWWFTSLRPFRKHQYLEHIRRDEVLGSALGTYFWDPSTKYKEIAIDDMNDVSDGQALNWRHLQSSATVSSVSSDDDGFMEGA